MATKLRRLKLNELSLVDSPANRSCVVTITKRDSAAGDFHAAVAEIQKRDKCSRFEALQKAPDEYPDEFDAYQEAGWQPPADPRLEAVLKGRARQTAVDSRCREIMKRDSVNRMDALHILHDEEPEIFEDETV